MQRVDKEDVTFKPLKQGKKIAENVNFEVYPMTKADLSEVCRIERECFTTEGWSAQLFADALEMKDKYIMLTALNKKTGRPAGFVIMSVVFDEVNLEDIAVDASCRRLGAGKLLIQAAKSAVEDFASFITLEVRARNAAAICLYSSAGFMRVGERRNYYSAPHDNAILMTLDFEEE